MAIQKIKSSNLLTVDYNSTDEKLAVRFIGGGKYVYSGITGGLFQEFMEAGSKGKFFHANIKNKFPTTKIDEFQEAVEIVNKFLDNQQYTGERKFLKPFKHENKDPEDTHIHVPMMEPFALFIVAPDGAVEDNYGTFLHL